MDTLEVLIRARAEVEKGWGQGYAVDRAENVCLLGALEVALGRPRTYRVACSDGVPSPLQVPLIRSLPPGMWHSSLPSFNDADSTTKEDVLALFDRAIGSLVPVGDSAHVHRTVA